MKITSFDRKNCGEVRVILEKALKDAGLEGVTISLGRGTFTPDEFGFKVSVQTVKTAADGNAIGSTLKSAMQVHGLVRTEWDGAKLVDFHPRKYKCPFIVEKGGKRYKYTVMQAKSIFS